ncbi:PTS sugar transporter subunit IIB [Olsenella umbonata]|uniref:PTS sugar transporter subunit IIB n=1 Tax=Parafannyhessea umbonata TaxID=604330 RepID=A0A7X9Y0P8_9ACTN|nr:PTS sugar transporter subunit IIB [Parafannyhessea umbonata]NMF26726.1 PTS sugar transporter subunit IIB [Parafannyhessea umbonata]
MRNIMLFCAAGMSTSMLVKKTQAAADEMGYEVEISAHPVAEVAKYGKDADILLLGPQLRFQTGKVRAQFPDKPVSAVFDSLVVARKSRSAFHL